MFDAEDAEYDNGDLFASVDRRPVDTSDVLIGEGRILEFDWTGFDSLVFVNFLIGVGDGAF